MELDRTERRVLGALIEKRWATPDHYPLSLNALVAACNQKSNRDPVLALESFEVEGCLLSLRQKGLVMLHERDGARVSHYGERLAEKCNWSRAEAAILAELLLRGPQTAPELGRRCERMAPVGGTEGVGEALRSLADRGFTRLLPKAAGQRHARWEHRLEPAGESPEPVAAPAPEPVPSAVPELPRAPQAPAVPDLRDVVERLQRDVEDLQRRMGDLERELL